MRKQKNKPDSRTKIFEAAIDEFSEFGFAGARVDRIAHQAGINKAMIYYHFDSKKKLYQAIIQKEMIRMVEIIRSLSYNQMRGKLASAILYLSDVKFLDEGVFQLLSREG